MAIVKFGDIVKDVKVNVDRSCNPYEFYVAGDHMDSEDLTIRRKGCFATDDVGPAFTRIFKQGQVLYGSRRTYLKKVAVADFEGITANTTFVLETKDENILCQRLLPFLMLTDGFTKWSIKKSKGSTNPYVLFSDLADYEFDLPPIKEQQKLAELLWAAYELKESYKKLLAASDEMMKSRFIEMFGDKSKFNSGPLADNVKEMFIGPFGSSLKNEYFVPCERGYCIVYEQKHAIQKTMNVETRYIDEAKYRELKRFSIIGGDIIVSCRGTIGEIFTVPDDAPLGIMHPSIMKIRLDTQKYDKKFFVLALEQYMLLHTGEAKGSGVKMAVTATTLGQEHFLLPPLAVQKRFASFIERIDKSKFELQNTIAKLDQVMKSLLP